MLIFFQEEGQLDTTPLLKETLFLKDQAILIPHFSPGYHIPKASISFKRRQIKNMTTYLKLYSDM